MSQREGYNLGGCNAQSACETLSYLYTHKYPEAIAKHRLLPWKNLWVRIREHNMQFSVVIILCLMR